MSDLLAIQDNLLKASAEELLRTDLLHMTTKEQNMHKEYLPNSYVLVHYRTGLPPPRLHTNWKGPMRVVKGLNSRYTFLDLITGKEKDYHVSDMKPFVFDSAIVDPLDIARRDQMEFFMHTYTDLCLAHPLETWAPFDIVVNSAYALLTMPVTYKPTNVVISPFIRYSGTRAYTGKTWWPLFGLDRICWEHYGDKRIYSGEQNWSSIFATDLDVHYLSHSNESIQK